MVIFLTAAWLLCALAAWPRFSRDEFHDRETPVLGLLMALSIPVMLVAVPLMFVGLWAVIALDAIPRRVRKWWSASWA
jgi:hypothetical protein